MELSSKIKSAMEYRYIIIHGIDYYEQELQLFIISDDLDQLPKWHNIEILCMNIHFLLLVEHTENVFFLT